MAEKIEMVTIKELRDAEGISQLELAENMMVSVSEVQKWEKLQPHIPGYVIMILSLKFSVFPHDILGAKGIKFDPYSDEYPKP